MADPVLLVTGAVGGIGSATARRFAAGGWRVAATDRDAADLDGLRRDLGGALTTIVAADLREVAACRAVVEAAAAAAGRLDCLVNAAGLWTEGPAEDTREEDFDSVLDVNLKGLFFMSAAAIPHLVKTGGSIVNLSSDAGLQGNTGAAVYCASKGAVSNLTRALALELAPRGVRVNAVCPCDVETPMLRHQAENFGDRDPEAYRRRLLDQYPQAARARFLRPDEVAELIFFLAQPAATGITGANLSIDFGLSAGI
ncbi:MAG TPA: SDR family oxidoreductase [Vicinamibacteria bacterium]|nr:SDR family oxidoreductase [Vicinamibacteria bacterium]